MSHSLKIPSQHFRWAVALVSLLTLMGCQARYDVDGETRRLLSENETLTGPESAIDILTEIGTVSDDGQVQADKDDVTAICKARTRKKVKQTFRFNPPGETCRWGKDGNLNPLNYFLQGRAEQRIELDIPEGAIPCQIVMDFPRQGFRYDDHFIFSLNNSVVASSYNFSSLLNSGAYGLLQYEWSKIVGTPWINGNEQVYCPAFLGENYLCNFPGHDQQGNVQIQLGEKHVIGAVANGTPLTGSFFQMVTIGDNDTLDCEHTGLEFDVSMEYVQ